MKLLALTALVILSNLAHAANYYFSSSAGDDNRSLLEAQNPATPWRSIQKLNAVFLSLTPGDSVFLKRGDIFEGKLMVSKSGTQSDNIVITAYGTGERPVISGFIFLRNFTRFRSNIWVHNLSSAMPAVLLLNDKQQALGRYPNSTDVNSGFQIIDAVNSSTSITDNELTGTINWTGGEAVIRKNRWILDRCPIVSHSGSTLVYTNTSQYNPQKNFGYFIQNHVNALDKEGEWAFDKTQKKLYLFSSDFSAASTPVQVSATEMLTEINRQSYITLKGIEFSGANETALQITHSRFITVDDCSFTYSGLNGVFMNYATNVTIKNSTFRNNNNNGITTQYGCNGLMVQNNRLVNTGMIPGLGKNGDLGYQALTIKGKNNTVSYNVIENTGYVPIRFEGDNLLIENNFINEFCSVKDDGAGIYTWNNDYNAPENISRVLRNNIILNGIGAGAGTSYPNQHNAHGIYLDDNSVDVDIVGNTVANCSEGAVYIHNSRKSKIRNNTFFSNQRQLYLHHDNLSPNSPIRNLEIRNNIIYSRESSQQLVYFRSIKDDLSQFGVSEDNHFSLPIGQEPFAFTSYRRNYNEFIQAYDLASWQEGVGKDKSSKTAPAHLAPPTATPLAGPNKVMNPTFDKDVYNVYGFYNSGSFKLNWDNSGKLDGGSMQVAFDESGNSRGLLFIDVGKVTAGKAYLLRFSLLGTSSNKSVGCYLRKTTSPYTRISDVNYAMVKDNRTEVELYFIPTASEAASTLVFDISDQSTVWFDNIRLHEATVKEPTTDNHVRFEYNASRLPKTIVLDGSYVDVTNKPYNGTVVLEPFKSIILIKISDGEKTAQTITFPAIVNKTYRDQPFKLEATASSNLAVSYRVVSGPATISGATLTITGAGEVKIEANQEGNELYLAAPAVQQVFTVAKKTQTISFPAISGKKADSQPFSPEANATSGLPVSYVVVSGPASVSGGMIVLSGEGTVVLEASQGGNNNYEAAAPVRRSFVVEAVKANKLAQTVTFNALADREFGSEPFELNGSSSSGLSVSYRVVSGPAILIGTTVTLTGAGVVAIEATQDGNDEFEAAPPVTRYFVASKAKQSIRFTAIPAKTAGDAPFNLTATATSGLQVDFVVISGPATVNGNVLTITDAGEVTVEAVQIGDENFLAAAPVRRVFTVSEPENAKLNQSISLGTLSYRTYTSPPFSLAATASSGLPVKYRVIAGPVSVTDDVVTITGVGMVTIEARQDGNDEYNPAAPVQRTFSVGKASQIITFPYLSNRRMSDGSFILNATSTSGLPCSYRVVSGPAVVEGSLVTLTGTGQVIIEATQNGDENFTASFPLYRTFNVIGAGETRQNQTINFPSLPHIAFSTEPILLQAVASSGLDVVYRVTSGPATLNDNILTVTGIGTVVVEATQPGNAAYFPAEPEIRSFRVRKGDQAISFGTLPYQTYNNAPFELSATASSGLPVSFRVVSGPVTISGTTVTITGVGKVAVEAVQPGDDYYKAAKPVQRIFTVGKAAQIISFPLQPNRKLNDAPFALNATSNGGLTVNYRVVSGPATVSGNIVTLTGTGVVLIEASQPGDALYAAAFPLTRSFTVLPPLETNMQLDTYTLRNTENRSAESALPHTATNGTIRVFPSPMVTNGFIELTLSSRAQGDVEIVDMAGRIVNRFSNRTFEPGQAVLIPLNAAGMQSGVYIVRFAGKNCVLKQRFQVQR